MRGEIAEADSRRSKNISRKGPRNRRPLHPTQWMILPHPLFPRHVAEYMNLLVIDSSDLQVITSSACAKDVKFNILLSEGWI
jgi:hypothetical protein